MKSVLDSRQLLAAKTLAVTGSFTLAGRYLSLTQSAVSHAIKALEDEVGCRLFARTGKGVTVTPAGKHFLQHLDRIFEQMEIARTLVSPRTAAGKDCLRLGVSTRARDFFLPVVKPAFQKEFPNRLIVLEPGDYRDGLELVQSGLLDLCFSVEPREHPALTFAPLFEDELSFIIAAGHPWVRRGAPGPEDLARGMLVLHQAFNNTSRLLTEHFQSVGLTVRNTVELVDYQQIKSMVLTGQCVGVLPPWLVAPELESGAIVALDIGPQPLVRHWGLAYDRKRTLALIDSRFIELCRQAVPGILSRLRGGGAAVHEKKVPAPITLSPVQPRYGAVAAVVGGVGSWFCNSSDWIDQACALLSA
jgi:DNA-binding transcriptional LysR family regulator